MFSILIVDDEKLVRADILYKVSRSGLNLKWVMEASSAEEAMEIVLQHKPDILITDIRMGEMSGIELIRRLRSVSNSIVSILISGYSEFSFAKEAISLNVVDYLLKPVKQRELTTTLSNAVAKVMEQRKIPQVQMYHNYPAKNAMNEALKERLYGFLNGTEETLDFATAALFPENTIYYQIGLIRLSIKQRSDGIQETEKPDYEHQHIMVQEIVQEVGGSRFFTINHFAQKRELIVIATIGEASGEAAEKALAQSFRLLHKKSLYRFRLILHIGVSSLEHEVSGVMLTQARQALDLRLSMIGDGEGQVYFFNQWKNLAAENIAEEDFKLYKSLLATGDISDALAVVRRIFSSQSPGLALHIRILYVEMICILAHTCVKKAGGSVVSMLGPECLGGGIVDQFIDRTELVESLCRTIRTTMTEWMPVSADVNSVMNNVKDYIEENFTNQELSTNYLSKRFCISLGYLSASYKKTFGITISKYIISLQMEYAKELLLRTKLPIQAVAENSGYVNLSYFMRTFKKYFCCTPSEYRENSQKTGKE